MSHDAQRPGIPDDVRAKITALFPAKRPAPAAPRPPRRGDAAYGPTAKLLAQINAKDPAVFRYALGLLATRPGGVPDAPMGPAVAQEMLTVSVATRIVSYRREIVGIGLDLAKDATNPAKRERVAALTAEVGDLERRFPAAAQLARAELSRDTTRRD